MRNDRAVTFCGPYSYLTNHRTLPDGAIQVAQYPGFKTAPTPVGAIADARVSDFLTRVYGWMFVGLAVTAGVAMYVASEPAMVQAIATNRLLFFGLVIAELGLAITLEATYDELVATIHAHPTLSEAVHEAVHASHGLAIHI